MEVLTIVLNVLVWEHLCRKRSPAVERSPPYNSYTNQQNNENKLIPNTFGYKMQGWGKTVVLGVDKPGAQLNLNSFEVLTSRKTLTGALFGGLKPKSDVPILVKRYLDKVINRSAYVCCDSFQATSCISIIK